ncbi:MAG TPA: hypothetical protein DDW85_00655 [Porphyromonadaceae bacterium]|nr:hypothetical protein [Porphyromonadaceae bacterium]
MTGDCYIDGIDIYTEYGVFIEGDGYNELLSFAALKEPDKNDWAEEHGIEVDLSSPCLQAQEITIDFAIASAVKRWRNFFVFLSAPGYRTVNISPLGLLKTLRVSEMPDLESFDGADMFSVRFVEDAPVVPIGYPATNANIDLTCVVSLDGKTLDKYGIIITEGLDELERAPKLKKALTRTNSLLSGQTYDTNFVRFAEKEVTFGCYLNALHMAGFWNSYNALFGDLLKPGLRTIGYTGRNYQAYYRKTGNWQLHSHSGPVVCEFDLTICFTAFVINSNVYLLASQDDKLITTEDGIFIDLKY